MPTRKLPDTYYGMPPCRHPEHHPATMIVRAPGTYEHTCPGCGNVQIFVVAPKPTLTALKSAGILHVAAAAIMDECGRVWHLPPPARHHNLNTLMHEKGVPNTGPNVTLGFLLSDGRFANRKAAKLIATAADQLLPRASRFLELFSEDVW